MICDRCYRPLALGAHGLYICPLEPRRAATVRPDSIPGGYWAEHGLCNADGTPRRYDSHSAITRECEARGLMRWTDLYEESSVKPSQEYGDWKSRSPEAQQEYSDLRADRARKARR